MKKIEAIIQPEKLSEVRDALVDSGIIGMTIEQVKGFGSQKGRKEMYRGVECKVDLICKSKISIIVKDSEVEHCIGIILAKARTGKIGDGKIFVLPVDDAIRIRTSERGEAAVR